MSLLVWSRHLKVPDIKKNVHSKYEHILSRSEIANKDKIYRQTYKLTHKQTDRQTSLKLKSLPHNHSSCRHKNFSHFRLPFQNFFWNMKLGFISQLHFLAMSIQVRNSNIPTMANLHLCSL